MKFETLEESRLQIPRRELESAFSPFIKRTCSEADPEWRAEIERRKQKIQSKYRKQRLLGWLPFYRRGELTIVAEYTKVWQESEFDKYALTASPSRISPWEWDGKRMFASDIGATRFRQLILVRLIELLQPKRVLEVGCGNGINLLLLACRFPDVEFTGLELTEQGYETARRFQLRGELPEAMQQYAPLPLVDPTAFRRIHFLQGTAAELLFGDNRFDLVQTILALEQMEGIRAQALSEMARTTSRYTIMMEPFRDINESGWPRMNVIRRNYFQGRIGDLTAYGLEPVMAIKDFPQEVFLKICAVLSEKRLP